MEEKKKRQRGKNFSYSEEQILLDLVEARKDILENKQSDAATWKHKEECWAKLAVEFGSQTGTVRNAKTLKDKYDNLKRRTKIEIAAKKHETYRAGGGPLKKQCVSKISERVASLLGDSATRLCNNFDSDFSNTNNACNSTLDFIDNNSGSDPLSLVGDVEEEKCALEDEDSETDETEENFSANLNQKWNQAKLKQKKSQKLTVEENNKDNKCISPLDKEKILLTKLQQEFYRNEDFRAAEKHEEEMKGLRMRNQLLELEIEEKKKKTRNGLIENPTTKVPCLDVKNITLESEI